MVLRRFLLRSIWSALVLSFVVLLGCLGGYGQSDHWPWKTGSRRQQQKQEYETQWPGYVLTYCYPNITIQLDRNMNVQTPKGTIGKFTMTSATKVEGNTRWPTATVQFLPSTKVASHIWFLPPAMGTPKTRDEDTPCKAQPREDQQQ
jgi:hypothetical protein